MTPAQHLVLIGLSFSGKSTVGALAARRLGLQFVDTDLEIERRLGKSVPVIFETQGEAAFRQAEREVVASVVAGPPSVIAAGGGAPLDESNRRLLWEGNLVMWLDVDPATAFQRLKAAATGTRRPLLTGDGPLQRLAELKERRQSVYAQAHAVIRTDALAPETVVDLVCEEFGRHGAA